MKIKSHYNYQPNEELKEGDFSPSQTQPDASLPIREMVERYTSGLLDLDDYPNDSYDIDDELEEDEFLEGPIFNEGVDPLSELSNAKEYIKQVSSVAVDDHGTERSEVKGSSIDTDATSVEDARSGQHAAEEDTAQP